MEPLEFRPKHSYNFWVMVGAYCFWFFYRTVLANRWHLEDPSSLPDNIILLVFIAALIAFLFRRNVKRVIINDRIVIEHYLAKPIELRPEDFIAITGSAIHLKGHTIDTTQYRNGKKLIREFEKRIAAGMLPSGGEALQQPQEQAQTASIRRLPWSPLSFSQK